MIMVLAPDGHRNRRPAEHLDGAQAAFAAEKPPIGRNDDGVKEPNAGDALGERIEVAHVAAVPLADADSVERPQPVRGLGLALRGLDA
jgi:hypothetical protein